MTLEEITTQMSARVAAKGGIKFLVGNGRFRQL